MYDRYSLTLLKLRLLDNYRNLSGKCQSGIRKLKDNNGLAKGRFLLLSLPDIKDKCFKVKYSGENIFQKNGFLPSICASPFNLIKKRGGKKLPARFSNLVPPPKR